MIFNYIMKFVFIFFVFDFFCIFDINLIINFNI